MIYLLHDSKVIDNTLSIVIGHWLLLLLLISLLFITLVVVVAVLSAQYGLYINVIFQLSVFLVVVVLLLLLLLFLLLQPSMACILRELSSCFCCNIRI